MKSRISLSVVFIFVWYFLSEFLFMPAWAMGASGMIFVNLSIFLAGLGAIWTINGDSYSDNSKGFPSIGIPLFSIAAILLVGFFFIAGFFNSSEFMNTDRYRNLIGEIKQTEFTANIQPIASHQMMIVDKGIAERTGDKLLGSDPGLGSRVELGEFTLQPVNGQLYWIAPLLHSGFFKWNAFSDEGTPGYVKVSATNQEDFGLVTKVDGKDLHIKYQTNAYFGDDLERHIYISGYRTLLYTDYTFEVDDNWNPMWTATVYDSKIGFGGDDATGVLTIDPQTGEIHHYNISDAPKWIDRIQPETFVKSQVNNWGNYIHGFFNFSDRDRLKVSDENSFVLGSDGRAYFYFGLTSIGKDESTVGFVMVDTRTKVAHWFKQPGATEKAARGSAEGKVQASKYVGSEGVTYNIDGHPTYEFLMKDNAGLMKLIALVNVYQHSIVGVGETRQEALQDYRAQLTSLGNSTTYASSEMVKETVSGRIVRISAIVSKGTTYFNFIIDKAPTVMFTAGFTVSDELALSRDDDFATVTYVKTDSQGPISVMTFDNTILKLKKDSVQQSIENKIDTVRAQSIQIKSDAVIDNKIDNLSKEDKRKLFKQLDAPTPQVK